MSALPMNLKVAIPGIEQTGTTRFRIPAQGKMVAAVDMYVSEEFLPDARHLSKLIQMASVSEVVNPIVVLPDVHFKIKDFVPSGLAVMTRDVLVPMFLGPANDAMALAWTGLNENDLTTDILDVLFDDLKQRICMFRRSEAIISEKELWPMLRFGGPAVYETWGFDPADLANMDSEGRGFAEGEEPTTAEVLTAFPGPGERPPALPDFVPWHDLVTAGGHCLGVLDGGSHFVELDVVDEVLDSDSATALALRPGQMLVAVHSGSADVGLIAHKHYLPPDDSEIPTLPADSELGKRFRIACGIASNFAFVNRLFILAQVRDALCKAVSRTFDYGILSDAPHDMLDTLEQDGGHFFLHRKGGVRAFPAAHFSSDHPFARTGRPFYFPAALGEHAYLMTNRQGNPDTFYTCSHGAGRRINKDEAVAQYDEESVVCHIRERNVQLYRFGVTEFAGQAPASYKDMDQVLDILKANKLAEPILRLRPAAVLKG